VGSGSANARYRDHGGRLDASARKRQLAEEAARQFHRYGFHRVALSDVANAVGITAPAVYRHFRNKKALLAGAISSGLDVVDSAFGDELALDQLLVSLTGAAVERRDVWVLLQRELRHLDAVDRAPIQARFADFVGRLAGRVQAERVDAEEGQVALSVTAALGALSSPATHDLGLPSNEYRRWLAAAAVAACRADLPVSSAFPADAAADVLTAQTRSRSDMVLDTAIALFHEHGYAGVSLDDIGAAVGMAGPSVYYHFSSKSELLVTAFTHATQWLAINREGLARNAAAGPTLQDVVHQYVDFAVRRRHLFGVYVTEVINLPPDAARRIKDALDADVADWSAALARQRPALTEAARLVLVHAASSVVNDVVRIGKLHTRPGIRAELQAILDAVLSADVVG
jgi:AcrR family transcriptional regulator